MTLQPADLWPDDRPRLPACRLKVGDRFVPDILNPRPEDVDLFGLERRLQVARRFANTPESLTVWEHSALVMSIAMACGESREVVRWCRYHDFHEGVIGDIPGPLKLLLAAHTNLLPVIEKRWDIVIAQVGGFDYPDAETRAVVHHYDKVAETVEWQVILGETPEPWNKLILPEQLAEWGRMATVLKQNRVNL